MATCKNCGAEITGAGKFCTNCGCPVENSRPVNAAPAATTTSKAATAAATPATAAAYAASDSGNLGSGKATASFVLGLIGVVFWFFGLTSIISLVVGIIGVVLASSAKKSGYTGGLRTAGLVLSIISLVFGALLLILIVCGVSLFGCAVSSLS